MMQRHLRQKVEPLEPPAPAPAPAPARSTARFCGSRQQKRQQQQQQQQQQPGPSLSGSSPATSDSQQLASILSGLSTEAAVPGCLQGRQSQLISQNLSNRGSSTSKAKKGPCRRKEDANSYSTTNDGQPDQTPPTRAQVERRKSDKQEEVEEKRKPAKSKDDDDEEGRVDFSHLKRDLSVDKAHDSEGDEGRMNELQTVETIVKNMEERVRQLSARADAAEDGRTRDEIQRLKRHLRDLACILSHLERGSQRPLKVVMKGKLGRIERHCPHSGRQLKQSRDCLADLKNKYEQSLLVTHADDNWPFVHLIASNRPPLNDQLPDCSSDGDDDHD